MWPATYRNCAVMGTLPFCFAMGNTAQFPPCGKAPLRQLRHGICVAKMLDNTSSIICAFGLASAAPRSPYRHLELCGIAYGFIIADIQGDKPDFQSSQTKKQGDKVYFKPLCGPHRRQNRAKAHHTQHPQAQKEPECRVFWAHKPGKVAPFLAVIPHLNMQQTAAGKPGAQFQHRNSNRADPRQQRGGQWQAAEGIQCAKAGPTRQNIVQWVVPRQAISSARYAVPPMANSTSCPGAARRWKQTDIQTPLYGMEE